MPAKPTDKTFEIGLVLAGAVSAGAYTAGVIDYLLETLETWQAAKENGQRVPKHNIKIKVITGASAGGMTAAISVVELFRRAALKERPAGYKSLMYQAWVEEIDIKELLKTDDLGRDPQIKSLLDSTIIDKIADGIIRPEDPPVWRPIPYVADKLKLYLTLSNLRGLPYTIKLQGETNLPYGMMDHADYQYIQISKETTKVAWRRLRNAAVATGAFPVGLASRLIKRDTTEYEERVLCDGRLVTNNLQLDTARGEAYHFVAVDGGVLNNEPIELARSVWNDDDAAKTQNVVGLESLDESEKEIIMAEQGRRALVIIDPFPDQPDIGDNPTDEDTGLFNILGKLIGAMRAQSLFKIEELVIAGNENIFSRFLVAPVRRTDTGHNAERTIACGFFHGFGGFLSRKFREHDYHLGRRNCQQFLKTHFVLPKQMVVHNEIFKDTLADDYFFRNAKKDPQIDYYPLIPVVKGSPAEAEQGKDNAWPSYDLHRKNELTEGVKRRVNAMLVSALPFGWVSSAGITFFIIVSLMLIVAGEFIKTGMGNTGGLIILQGLKSVYILVFQIFLLVIIFSLIALRVGIKLIERKLVKGALHKMLSAMKDWGIKTE